MLLKIKEKKLFWIYSCGPWPLSAHGRPPVPGPSAQRRMAGPPKGPSASPHLGQNWPVPPRRGSWPSDLHPTDLRPFQPNKTPANRSAQTLAPFLPYPLLLSRGGGCAGGGRREGGCGTAAAAPAACPPEGERTTIEVAAGGARFLLLAAGAPHAGARAAAAGFYSAHR